MASSVSQRDTTWVSPRTWTTGELVTKTIMDTHVRDNLNALKTSARGICIIDEGSDYSTSSTSWADMDATDLSITMTTAGGDLLILWMASAVCATAPGHFDVTIDSTRQGGDDGLTTLGQITNGIIPCCIAYIVTGVSAASHVFRMQHAVSTGGTMTTYAGAGTSTKDSHPRFCVMEI